MRIRYYTNIKVNNDMNKKKKKFKVLINKIFLQNCNSSNWIPMKSYFPKNKDKKKYRKISQTFFFQLKFVNEKIIFYRNFHRRLLQFFCWKIRKKKNR